MSEDSNGTPPDENSNGAPPEVPEPMDLEEAKRLIQEAQARGEDTLPILRRIVLSTIDKLAKRVPRGAPGEDSYVSSRKDD